MRKILLLNFILLTTLTFSQDYGDFPSIPKQKLLYDVEILYQGLDKFHSGMYWYTPKDSVDVAFAQVKEKIDRDLNLLEFHKLIAPLVALSREDHTLIKLPLNTRERIGKETRILPLTIVFLDQKMYGVFNGSENAGLEIKGKEIESINGETPIEIVEKIGTFFSSDGYIKTVKYQDSVGFNFSRYYFYYYGLQDNFKIKFRDKAEIFELKSLTIPEINTNVESRNKDFVPASKSNILEFEILNNHAAYLGLNSFNNFEIRKNTKNKKLKKFLKNSFKLISENNIDNLIVDVSKNSGGTEGNEGLVYSYLGENYQKYLKVRAKNQKAIVDNGVDKPLTLNTFGFLERVFVNKKMKDGSLERKQWIGYGLKAFKEEPKHKFDGKVYVIISPITYSGGSEFSNMVYSNTDAIFVGQETGGGYYGNTSGYRREVILPNSLIIVNIPALQFMMNVKQKIPFGRGVIPHYKVVPTFDEYMSNTNAPLEFILEKLAHVK
ncbi:S41 family peptidase [Flavobacterium ardleyense]|uniref:S41 family peptidase n=1 Tax=Flavobacterium ardleyense TaxID=2038737 RepID=UPI00298C94DA|nr:S41 family peptidase [Flavobacterium ardleyense]